MRTVGDIIEAVQEQQPVTDAELRLALLALYYSTNIDDRADYETASLPVLRMRSKEAFRRRFDLMKADPSDYLGKNWTPGTPENTAQRAQSKRILAGIQRKLGHNPKEGAT